MRATHLLSAAVIDGFSLNFLSSLIQAEKLLIVPLCSGLGLIGEWVSELISLSVLFYMRMYASFLITCVCVRVFISVRVWNSQVVCLPRLYSLVLRLDYLLTEGCCAHSG